MNGYSYFAVTAKRDGDSVTYPIQVESSGKSAAIVMTAAYDEAKSVAQQIFKYKTGDTKPTVTVKPIADPDGSED